MIPTPEMLQAAHKAWKDTVFQGKSAETATEAALTAALALIPGEPVGWIWKLPDGDEWQYRDGSEKPDSLGLPKATAAKVILQPVYVAPAPLPVAVKIKPLEWKNRTAKTDAGVMYAISGHRKLGERGFILRIVSGLGTENHNIDDFDEAKAAAQQDYEQRIRSALSSPVGGTEETVTDALRRISELTPARANARTANDLHLTVKAIADTALAGISPTPASDIAALREENEIIRNAGIRFLKAADAYVDGEDIPEETLMVEYGDALDAFRSALSQQEESRG